MNCYHCGSEQTRKHGKKGNGKQRYRCSMCGRSFREHPEGSGYTETAKERILRAYQERASLRGLTRIFGVSRNTVSKWLKKAQMPPLEATLAPVQPLEVLELDELWSFVRHRRRGVIWLWLALFS